MSSTDLVVVARGEKDLSQFVRSRGGLGGAFFLTNATPRVLESEYVEGGGGALFKGRRDKER
jgi:hypothetical protein